MGAKRGGIMVVLVAIYTRGTNSDRPRLGMEPPELVSFPQSKPQMAHGDYRLRGECGGTSPSTGDHLVGDNPGFGASLGRSPFASLSHDLWFTQPRD
jgi:hypothetical protein